MTIQWYPGHMHKAGKEIKQALTQVDLVIEVLDARIPFSSQNPMLAKLRGDKPCIKVLNKADLADPNNIFIWQSYLEQQESVKTLVVTKGQPDKAKQLVELCRKLVGAEHSPDRQVHALIMGIPNVGKSTLINALAGRVIAKTGNEPAVTKHQQRIAIAKNVVLLDTPGMLWPNLENQPSAYRLAATGAIKDTAISHDDIAWFVLDYLAKTYPNLLENRFHLVDLLLNGQELLEVIGRKRGCIVSGGRVDHDKTAKIILNELRSGGLGRISLETPDMMQQELAQVAVNRQIKADKKRGLPPKPGIVDPLHV